MIENSTGNRKVLGSIPSRVSKLKYSLKFQLIIDDVKRYSKSQVDTPRKKFYLNFGNSYFKLISSIRSKNFFRANINLFQFNTSRFKPFLNKRNYFFNIIYLIKKIFFGLNTVLAKTIEIIYLIL